MAEVAISLSDDDVSTSTTELLEGDDEELFREEVRTWIEVNAAALFHVECLKWFAREAKKKNLKK